MSKSKNTIAQTAAPAAATNKSKAIRDYAAANPNATPSDIAKALQTAGIDVNSSRVSNVLSKKQAAVNVDDIKAAAQFVKLFKNAVEAKKAIESVGSFVDACGNSASAAAAVDAVAELAEVVK